VSGWTATELDTIAAQDELTVAAQRRDGSLTGARVVWVVRVGDEVFVRSVNGPGAAWFRSTQVRHAGHISCGELDKDVDFDDVSDDITLNAGIDAAYRAKYRRYARNDVEAICSVQARSTTLQLCAAERVTTG
jgi:hypothetical protein